jgi:alkaline phosphatase D
MRRLLRPLAWLSPPGRGAARRRPRRLLPLGALLLLLMLAARPVSDGWYLPGWVAVPPRLTHGVVLGAVTDRSVKLWARAEREGVFQVEVKRQQDAWPGRVVGNSRLTGARDFSGVVELTDLAPSTGYDYRPLADGRPAGAGGTFRTLPAAGRPGAFRFTVGGDLSAEFAPFSILDRLRAQQPDFSLLLGDLIYADHPAPIPAAVEAYQAKYRANWSDPSFQQLTREVPSFMMWDDHEIENDYDAGRTGRYLPARAALEDYVARLSPAPRRSGQLYYSFQAADVDFFVLDTRSSRSPIASQDGPAKTMLGPEQRADLEAWLSSSQAPFKVVLSSVPLHQLGAPRIDSWASYSYERTGLFEFIRQHGIGGVVVLSGDQHWSSLVHHEAADVWEFNATPLAQQVNSQKLPSDPRLLIGYNASPAFGLIEVDTRGSTPRMTFNVVDDRGVVRASHSIQAAPSR